MKVIKLIAYLFIALVSLASFATISYAVPETALQITWVGGNLGEASDDSIGVGLAIYGFNFNNGATPEIRFAGSVCTLVEDFPWPFDTEVIQGGKTLWMIEVNCLIPTALMVKMKAYTGLLQMKTGPKGYQVDKFSAGVNF
jgi:hypothetical protein